MLRSIGAQIERTTNHEVFHFGKGEYRLKFYPLKYLLRFEAASAFFKSPDSFVII